MSERLSDRVRNTKGYGDFGGHPGDALVTRSFMDTLAEDIAALEAGPGTAGVQLVRQAVHLSGLAQAASEALCEEAGP